MERPRSKVRLSDIPDWLITKLAYEGFEPKGNNGSFYKFENGYTYRISTHKTFVPSETIIYEDIDELKNIKLSKFQKLTRKFEKKLERRLQRRERERNAKYERY